MSKEKFEQLVSVYRATQFEACARAGTLTVATTEQLTLLIKLFDDPREFGLAYSGLDASKINVGDTIHFHVEDPRVGLGCFAQSLEDVLNFRTGRIRAQRFFLLDEVWASGDADPPELVARYQIVLKLIELFGECAAYLDKDAQELVLVDGGKLTIPVSYSVKHLTELDVRKVEELLSRFGLDTHREQKLSILAKEIRAICSPITLRNRFAFLLEHVAELLKRFDEGYRLFVADFSYEKIVNQMEVAKLEELAKIHKTFADVQNQILGIPVATIIVATQLKPTSAVDATLWVNSAVLVGVWVFAILTWLVLRNQLHTLNAIEEEIDRKWKKIETDYAAIKDIVSGTFTALKHRLRTQRVAFRAVDAVVVVGVLMAHIVYLALTKPALIFVCSYSVQLFQYLCDLSQSLP
ncbi:hypothetical protein R0382_003633 [Jeongeupia wiesaeckerbachi]